MTRKSKTITIVVAVLIGVFLIIGGVLYACWHTWINQGPLPVVAGVFEGKMEDNNGEILSYARLEITEISEGEFLSASGVNVVKDASRRRTADFYRFELYIGEDKDNLKQVDVVDLKFDDNEDPNYPYYSNKGAESAHVGMYVYNDKYRVTDSDENADIYFQDMLYSIL